MCAGCQNAGSDSDDTEIVLLMATAAMKPDRPLYTTAIVFARRSVYTPSSSNG